MAVAWSYRVVIPVGKHNNSMKKNLLLLFINALIFGGLFAQQPPGSCDGGTAVLSSTCDNACVLCYEFDGLTFNNSITDLGEAPPGFCAPQLHNTQWVGFVAGSSSITIDVTVFNCNNGDGLQIGIYTTSDCNGYSLVSNCEEQVPPGTTTFTAPNTIPGAIYFVVVDGYSGDICDFTVDVTSGIAEAPDVVGTANIIVPPAMCPGGTYPFTSTGVTGAGIFEWTLEGNVIGYNPEEAITMPDAPGTYEICVTPSNPCNTGAQACTQVNVEALPDIDLGLITICQGDVFTSDGFDFSTPGPHSYTISTPEGCDQGYTLELALTAPVYHEIDTTICSWEAVQVGDDFFEYSGTYMVLLETVGDACDSIVTLNLTVSPSYMVDLDEDICEGETYIITDGMTTYEHDHDGYYEDLLTTVDGCDSLIRLSLLVNSIPSPTEITDSICPSDSYFVGTNEVDMPGDYSFTLTTQAGCDSIVVLHLSYYQPSVDIVTSICNGDTYEVGDNTYDTTGVYTIAIPLPSGCDSIVNLDLTVNEVIRDTFDVSICTGQTYSVGDSIYTDEGFYTNFFMTTSGCDSIIYTNLTVSNLLEQFLTIGICEGDTYAVGDSLYSTTGMYQNSFVTIDGCDSIVYLNLSVHQPQVTNVTTSICTGESYFIGTTPYTESGNYQEIFSSDLTGCDSTVNLSLTVLEHSFTTLTEEICLGGSYAVGSSVYASTGIFRDTLTAANMCDSIVTLNLTVLPTFTISLTESICDGETYTVGNNSYTQSGIYQDILTAANGCDSTVNLNLTVLDHSYTNLIEQICQGASFPVGNSSYTTTGTYTDTLQAVNGCDSIISLNLQVDPVYNIQLNASICEGATYEVGNSVYNSTGIYQDTLTTVNGCDSIVNLSLTITEFYQIPLNASICEGESYIVGSEIFDTTGEYQIAFIASDGCDSFVNLALTVLPVLETDVTPVICNGETYELNGSSYTASGSYQQVLTASTGCDSVLNIDLTVNPIYESNINHVICEGESFSVGNSVFDASGDYTEVLTTVNGCDSIIHLSLIVNPILQANLVAEICEGQSYEVGSSSYIFSGNYTDHLTSVVTGCDSVVHLDLTVYAPAVTNLTEAICQGDSYFEGNNEYTESGVYTNIYTSSLTGCDSIVNLDLTVHPVFTTAISEVICDDESYSLGGANFSSTGDYEVNLTTTEGCDSIVMLNLTVHPCQLNLLMEEQPVSCHGASDGTIDFEMTIGVAPYTYVWEGTNNPFSGSGIIEANFTTTTISGLIAGTYLLSVTDSFGVSYEVEISIIEPLALDLELEAKDYGSYQISCHNESDGMITALMTGGTPPYSYEWSNGLSGEQIEQLSSGQYKVTVTDALGCRISKSIELLAPLELMASIAITNPKCYGDDQGSAMVVNLEGGITPYLFSIDQQAFSTSAEFANIKPGEHKIIVEDAFGCTKQLPFTIEEPEELTVDIVADEYMELGSEMTIRVEPAYDVEHIIWTHNDTTFTCEDTTYCLEAIIRPYITTDYHVMVVDANGCTASADITIHVEKPRNIFIPSAFSPNGDNVNDIFFINGGIDVARIKSFVILNRWGEIVAEFYDFQPNDPFYGWDGMHRGKIMNSGVYVYFAEVDFIDGESVLYKGDVVLIR